MIDFGFLYLLADGQQHCINNRVHQCEPPIFGPGGLAAVREGFSPGGGEGLNRSHGKSALLRRHFEAFALFCLICDRKISCLLHSLRTLGMPAVDAKQWLARHWGVQGWAG